MTMGVLKTFNMRDAEDLAEKLDGRRMKDVEGRLTVYVEGAKKRYDDRPLERGYDRRDDYDRKGGYERRDYDRGYDRRDDRDYHDGKGGKDYRDDRGRGGYRDDHKGDKGGYRGGYRDDHKGDKG